MRKLQDSTSEEMAGLSKNVEMWLTLTFEQSFSICFCFEEQLVKKKRQEKDVLQNDLKKPLKEKNINLRGKT